MEATGTTLTVRSFERKTGHLQWAVPVPGQWHNATVTEVAEGRVYVFATARGSATTQKGFMMGLGAGDGKVLWKNELDVSSNKAVVRGSELFTLAGNSAVTAYDGQTGKQLWRTALSKDCDPAKSKLGDLCFQGGLCLDKDRLYAAINTYPFNPDGPADRAARDVGAEDGVAVLDLQTGKQTGYFNDKGVTDRSANPINDLHVQGDVVIAERFGLGCLGIDRKTLQLEWYIPASRTVTADGVLYVNTLTATGAATTEILAVPVEARR